MEGLNGAKGEDGDRNGSGKGDNQVLGGKREKKRKKVMNGFESDQRLLGRREERSQWVSQHFTHYVFNQIYIQGHRCVTGRLMVLQSDGGRRRNIKSSGNKEGGSSAMDIYRETFPVCPVVCSSICAATLCFITQLPALIDKQKHEAAI